MIEEWEDLLEISADLLDKAKEDLDHLTDMSVLSSWAVVIQKLNDKGHQDIVMESFFEIRNLINLILDKPQRFAISWYKTLKRHKEHNSVPPLLPQYFFNWLLKNYQAYKFHFSPSQNLNPSELQAVNLISTMCIKQIADLYADLIRQKTHGRIDVNLSGRGTVIEKIADTSAAVDYIDKMASGKIKIHRARDQYKILYRDALVLVKGYVQKRLVALIAQEPDEPYRVALNKILIRTYKALQKELQNETEARFEHGYSPNVVFGNVMDYILQQMEQSDDYRVRGLRDKFVETEYLPARDFMVKTWLKASIGLNKLIMDRGESNE